MQERTSHALRGTLCAALGGVCWGFSGTCGQYLFSRFAVSSLWLTCLRLLAAGLVMTLLALPKFHDAMRAIWRSPREAALLVCYGVFGLLMCQYAYMTAISYSNAATATVLQTLNLVLIMLLACLRSRRRPRPVELTALVLALAGTFLLATGGNIRHMALSPQGLFWGLAAAVAVVSYVMLPRGLMARWGRAPVTALGMLAGGIAVNLAARSWTMEVRLPLQGWLAAACIIILGTIVAFNLIMQGIQDVGPVKASMLAATEPLSATVFSALWLGTAFSLTDLVGFACIISTIFLLAKTA